MALGRAIEGEAVIADLAELGHLLVAGAPRSGKSAALAAMILSLVYRCAPETCRFLLIDTEGAQHATFGAMFGAMPHLLQPPVTDPRKARDVLARTAGELDERQQRMAKLEVSTIRAFNDHVARAAAQGQTLRRRVQTGFDRKTGEAIYEEELLALEPMPRIIIVVDGLAEVMVRTDGAAEASLLHLAQEGAAAGMHLLLATDRTSPDILTPALKEAITSRLSFRAALAQDSEVILGEPGAEDLLGQGDLLFRSSAGELVRLQGPLVVPREIERVASHLTRHVAANKQDAHFGHSDGLLTPVA